MNGPEEEIRPDAGQSPDTQVEKSEPTVSIEPIKEEDLEPVAIIFADAFNQASGSEDWTKDTALEYMKYWYERRPDLFFVAKIDNKAVGGIVGEIMPLWDGPSLVDIDIFVEESARRGGKGVAKKLLTNLLTTASEKYNANNLRFVADGTKRHPMSWYKRIGFSETGWVHMSGNIEEALQKIK